ncbi:MAG: rhomboid family intramembrane serine protease [Chitinivibrionia bacterium]|nr:rhomboid family intramembrane serine protease [Chitinivibrionia bacterium]
MSNIFTDRNTGQFSAINFVLIITLAIHAIVLLAPQIGMYIMAYGGLRPSAVIEGQVWRLLTYAFLHSTHNFFHIAFNMLGLWMFGKEIEYMWGSRRFFEFYFFSAIFAGVFSLLMLFFAPNSLVIGASGAIMAILVVYAYYFPNRQLLFFFVFPMKVRTAVIIYAVISVLGSGSNVGGVAHITHLGGLIAGFIWIHIGDRFDLIVRNIGAFFQNASTKRERVQYTFRSETPSQKVNSGRAETVDKILDKINEHGIHSLTPSERKILQNASADYRNNR